MAIEQIDVEQIQDNPYQARQTYHRQDIDNLAASIKTHGLLEMPVGRRKDGNVELAFGHLRKRAFLKLTKEYPKMSGKMPVDIRDLTDEEMALFALEENIKRRDITPIELARAVDKYLTSFPNETEVKMAAQLNMTQGNVSNMRRVVHLPDEILEKIDQGRINFTMARELLVFQDLLVGETERWSSKEEGRIKVPKDAKYLMLQAIGEIRTEGRPYGPPATVEGMQKATHSVAKRDLKALERPVDEYYRDAPLFDTREAGCLECQHMIRTHPTKTQTAHWCTNIDCWDQKQHEHKDNAAAEALTKMKEDVFKKVAQVETARESTETISQEIPAHLEERADQMQREIDQELDRIAELEAYDEDERARIEQVKQLPADYPCHGCLNVKRCDRTTVVAGEDGKLTCEQRVTKETAEELKQKATVEIPEELRSLTEEKAGTRAQVLDLNELYLNRWGGDLKQSYALLSNELERMSDPDECLERCTQGFHYAFDSRRTDSRLYYVCTNPKCLSKKKAAFTRAKNAEGQAGKNAERKAIKQAIAQTTTLDRPRIKLILLAQIDGSHITKHYYGLTDGKNPETWLWEKLSAGTPAIERKDEDLFKRIDKLPDEELARLVVEFMLYYLTDKGDIGRYEIRTTRPLNWMGIGVNVKEIEGEGKDARS
ncbi:Nucleoid occlusion protein [subsurface metagenome]